MLFVYYPSIIKKFEKLTTFNDSWFSASQILTFWRYIQLYVKLVKRSQIVPSSHVHATKNSMLRTQFSNCSVFSSKITKKIIYADVTKN